MKTRISSSKHFFLILLLSGLAAACTSVSGGKTAQGTQVSAPGMVQTVSAAARDTAEKGVVIMSAIEIQSGTPSEAVRNFYKAIREKRFQDAMMMTNMKAAVEGLSLEEAKDLAPDFEPLAAQVPADLVITGEQVSGNKASVFLKLPADDSGSPTSDEIKLRKDGDAWVILSGDDKDEADAKKQGKQYFFNVRIDIHHQEAQNMLERIYKAQMVYVAQTKGLYGDMDILVNQGLLPVDVNSSFSTGYNYSIVLSPDKMSYFVNAIPAKYGKSGKMSFLMEVSGKNGSPKTKSNDNGGMPLKK
jgi:hypothetical protein